MRIIAKRTLREYWLKHANSRKDLEEWYTITSKANWVSPHSVKKTYPKASIVAENRVVFNISGGNFRLVVKMAYRSGICFIRFVGTHKEYDKIDVTKV